MKYWTLSCAVVVAALGCSLSLLAKGINPVIPFQAVLTKSADGSLVTTQPTQVSFSLLYADDGSPTGWAFVANASQFSFNRGMLSCNLGQDKLIPTSGSSAVDFSRPLKLSIDYGAGVESVDIHPSAYAMYAVKSGTATAMRTTDLLDVDNTIPAAANQVLKWNQTNAKYERSILSSAVSYSGRNVVSIDGSNAIGLQAGTAGTKQTTRWTGSQWEIQNYVDSCIAAKLADTAQYARHAFGEVPVGSIIAFSGDTAEVSKLKSLGWAPCDGTSLIKLLLAPYNLSSTQLTSLSNILGSANWSSGNTSLPDLRGYFLRGAYAGGLQDPSGLKRDSSTGSSDRVPGTYELDSYQGHGHKFSWKCEVTSYASGSTYSWPRFVLGPDNIEDPMPNLGCSGNKMAHEPTTLNFYNLNYGVSRHGVETRPKNIAVNYIIKIR